MEITDHSGLNFCATRLGNKPHLPDLVLLHGFLGSGKQFLHLIPELSKAVNPVTVDIIPTAANVRFDPDSLVAGLQKTLAEIRSARPGKTGRPLVLGYNMGGRLALSWAVRYPERVTGLVLESATAGIADPEERRLRREADERNAHSISTDYASFLDEWERNPLFMMTGYPQHNMLKTIQRGQDPDVMARWLSDFGTGVMPPVWDQLHRIEAPVLLVSGAADPKFCDLAGRMNKLLPRARHVTVLNAGHRVHMDNPAGYLDCLRNFIASLDKDILEPPFHRRNIR